MNRYIVLGILLIVFGTFFMTQITRDYRLILLGVVLNGFGLLFMTKGSSLGSDKAKKEILDKINQFRKEINLVKGKKKVSESLQEIYILENEFNEWAEDFLKNFESIQIAKKKSEILLNEKEIKLSKQWRDIYEYVVKVIHNMLVAFNEKTKAKIEFTLPEIPKNLFNKEAESYRGRIIFDDNNAWAIKLQIIRPYKSNKIPSVVLEFYHGEYLGSKLRERVENGLRSSFLLLSFNFDKKCIELEKGDLNLYVGDVRNSYSIEPNKYKGEIKELFKKLIEYQLISL